MRFIHDFPATTVSPKTIGSNLWLHRAQTLSQPFFERSDPDLNYLTQLGHHVCAVVQDTTQFDFKLTVLSDALHQGVDEIAQGSELAVTDRTRVAADGSLNLVRLSRSDLTRFDRDEQAYELKSASSAE